MSGTWRCVSDKYSMRSEWVSKLEGRQEGSLEQCAQKSPGTSWHSLALVWALSMENGVSASMCNQANQKQSSLAMLSLEIPVLYHIGCRLEWDVLRGSGRKSQKKNSCWHSSIVTVQQPVHFPCSYYSPPPHPHLSPRICFWKYFSNQ